jgi:hypothetical protein
MIIRSLSFILLVVSLPAHAADAISSSFKAKVEHAFQAPTTEDRIALLTDSVHGGTDSEVARAVGVYFPNNVLRTARNDKICVPQVDDLLNEIRVATEMGASVYFAEKSHEYRERLIAAIECVHTAYAEGIPVHTHSDTPRS